MNMVINQGAGTTPSASVEIPSTMGLMDIARFYSPKVHIFYKDRIDGQEKFRLLFSGIIVSVSYSRQTMPPGKSLQLVCQHRYFPINDFLIDYSGWLNLSTDLQNGDVKPANANSQASILSALKGVMKGVGLEITEAVPNGVPEELPTFLHPYQERVKGIPGVIVNYWQQLKRDTFQPSLKPVSDSFTKLYRPLVEDGLKFFQRMSGHPYLEEKVEQGRLEYDCKEKSAKLLIPPSTNTFLVSAVQAEMAYRAIRNYLTQSGELTNLYQVFSGFYESIDYEILTLASPALSKVGDSLVPTDTIVKPKLPFYYSPSCNVIYPNMYTGISVSYDEYNIPTRVELRNQELPDSGELFFTRFRAPHSIRKAIASGVTNRNDSGLKSTTGPAQGKVGLYEQGRGVKRQFADLPPWIAHLSDSSQKDFVNEGWPDKNLSGDKYNALEQLRTGWATRFPGDEAFNPWAEKQSGVLAHHRLLFTTADYYYTQFVARSKAGNVQGLFNPYIIPGYPMDIISGSPGEPCFHALCSSVSHQISDRGVYTSISFVAAMTYSELVNYYVPFVHPWLQVQLGLAEKQTIVNNSDGLKGAIEFYGDVLGKEVTAVSPEMLYDFATGTPKPMGGFTGDSIKGSNGGELNLNLTYEGNMAFAYRPIEDQESIQNTDGIKFIPMQQNVYNPSVLTYTDDFLLDESSKLELGQSQFLDYNKYLE